ncbi:MAG TPA: rod shape-determining protein MreC [Blastocatellia bacterium]|nr:rod shape-determining protein MreC [Blastocatellia bacterium]
MISKPIPQKAPWILAALLLSQVVLMSANAKHPESEQSVLRTWLMTVLTPVTKAVGSVISGITGAVDNIAQLRGARDENTALRQRIDQLTAERDQAVERAAQLELLRVELGLPSQPQYPEVAANVVSRDISMWYQRLIIDRGTMHGLRRDLPVVTNAGVVGRIISLGPNYAVVQVITDKHAGLGAMLQRSRAPGEVRGVDGGRCELKSINSNESVETGETVVTTGLDRVYPKGLVVGTVASVENNPNAPWKKIYITPSARIDRAEQVLVLLVEQKDFPMDETVR